MNRNRVRRMTGLLLMSALLAFGLAACGGDEPVAVTPPPAPPPAPPPFQPEAVEVALGASGTKHYPDDPSKAVDSPMKVKR